MRLSIMLPFAALLIAGGPALAASPETLIARAAEADRAGKTDDATVLYQAAVVAAPQRPESYVALAGFYARHGDQHFALKYYDEALGLDPTLTAALDGAGRANLAVGNRAAAQAMLARLQHVCPGACRAAGQLAAAVAAAPPQTPAEQKASLDK